MQTIKNIFKTVSGKVCTYLFIITALLLWDYDRQMDKVPEANVKAQETLLYVGYDKVIGAASWVGESVKDVVNYINPVEPVDLPQHVEPPQPYFNQSDEVISIIN